jgi:Raf kinase inhibitor-like YbhB/YbcL family protein
MAGFQLFSDSFSDGGDIPKRHTCDGENVSPGLRWSGAPDGARSLALIMDDPDAPVGTFTHWLAWGLDPAADGLAEGEPAPAEGRNDFGEIGYGGPCPPPGHGRHRYVFRLHALDTELALAPGARRDRIERALDGHVLQIAQLTGRYARGPR